MHLLHRFPPKAASSGKWITWVVDVDASGSTESYFRPSVLRLGAPLYRKPTPRGVAVQPTEAGYHFPPQLSVFLHCHKDLQHCSIIWAVTLRLCSDSPATSCNFQHGSQQCRQNYNWSNMPRVKCPRSGLEDRPVLYVRSLRRNRAMVGWAGYHHHFLHPKGQDGKHRGELTTEAEGARKALCATRSLQPHRQPAGLPLRGDRGPPNVCGSQPQQSSSPFCCVSHRCR